MSIRIFERDMQESFGTVALVQAIDSVPTDVLARVARGELDVHNMIVAALAQRGVDHAGAWVGFSRATELAELAIRARLDAAAPRGQIPEDLAKAIANELGFRTLTPRGKPSLDVREVDVKQLASVLQRAYTGE
jgi:hypothetical protein